MTKRINPDDESSLLKAMFKECGINIVFEDVISESQEEVCFRMPNKTTQETFEHTDRGENLNRYKSTKDMFDKLKG